MTFGNTFYRWIVDTKSSEQGKELEKDDIERYHLVIYALDSILHQYTIGAEASYNYV
jgi:hypothetical protein